MSDPQLHQMPTYAETARKGCVATCMFCKERMPVAQAMRENWTLSSRYTACDRCSKVHR